MTKMSHTATGPNGRGDYEIGYGRPPKDTRFKLGNHCNPRGRPKRKKTAGELIEKAMNQKVKIAVDGRPTTMTKQEVIIHNLVNAAARGDHKAINMLFSLKARYQDSSATTIDPAEFGLNDQEIIDEFLANSAPAKPAAAPVDSSPAKDEAQPVDGAEARNEAQQVEGNRGENEPESIEPSKRNAKGPDQP
jgi:hypothetical protein